MQNKNDFLIKLVAVRKTSAVLLQLFHISYSQTSVLSCVRAQNEIRFYISKFSALMHTSLQFISDFTSIPVLVRCYKITSTEHFRKCTNKNTDAHIWNLVPLVYKIEFISTVVSRHSNVRIVKNGIFLHILDRLVWNVCWTQRIMVNLQMKELIIIMHICCWLPNRIPNTITEVPNWFHFKIIINWKPNQIISTTYLQVHVCGRGNPCMHVSANLLLHLIRSLDRLLSEKGIDCFVFGY